MTTELFIGAVGLAGAVIAVVALLSGLVERSGVPQVGVLLALGAALGPAGLGLLEVTLESPVLRVVATLSLTLVLFTDALSLDLGELRRHARLALLVLGPGTLLSAALVAWAGWWLLDLHPAAAAVLGAALASTDPVLLRGLLRRPDLPGEVRQALKIESGLNDVVLLPVVLCALPFLASGPLPDAAGWGSLALDLMVLGPGAGLLAGVVAIQLLNFARQRIGVRRDYESLYSLGVAFSAFAAAEAVQGSGFLAAFAAGLVIASFDLELCDCFMEYGETTAELLLLFTFVLFGSSLVWSGLAILDGPTLAFAAVALVARPLACLLSLVPTRLSTRSRALIAWFGPRGLSSLLLVLVAVFAGAPDGERLFALSSLVVLLSVVIHGGSLMAVGRLGPRRRAGAPEELAAVAPAPFANAATPGHAAEAEPDAAAAAPRSGPADPSGDEPRLTVAEVQAMRAAGLRVTLLDARSHEAWASSEESLPGSVRIDPVLPVRSARSLALPPDDWLIAYCT
jgi:NhaP-type Na+/H+ or K+/H+ antiporter